MADPIAPQAFPYFAAVEEGKKYQWCACGRSAAQPFCDGSHAGTGITPVEYTATATKKNVLLRLQGEQKWGAV